MPVANYSLTQTSQPLNDQPAEQKLNRRKLLATAGQAFAGAPFFPFGQQPLSQNSGTPVLRGQLKQSACRGPYRAIPLEDLCREAVAIGIKGIDLVAPEDWPTIQKYGLVPTMTKGGGTIPDACNRKDLHEKLWQEFSENIPRAAKHNVPNVITFSGNRKGMSDGEGLENCALILNRVKAIAEQHNVTICMELLNSKVNHKDYQCDHTAWGVELVKRVNSPRFKLLYDIYHMQIMEGDIIRTIRDNIQHIAHFHTGGNPGRNELDETQELNWRAIARAIVATGFTGYLAHEFSPKREPLTSLREAAILCDV